jgi:hypothetical protein
LVREHEDQPVAVVGTTPRLRAVLAQNGAASQLPTHGLTAQVLGDSLAANAESRHPPTYSAKTNCDQLVIDDVHTADSRPNRVG